MTNATTLLQEIDSPDDLKNRSLQDLQTISDELRQFLIESVLDSGGHFASGLGVVELSVALNHVFNPPFDKIIWDVGHQAYPHKILTGRKDRIHTIRKKGAFVISLPFLKVNMMPLALVIHRRRLVPL